MSKPHVSRSGGGQERSAAIRDDWDRAYRAGLRLAFLTESGKARVGGCAMASDSASIPVARVRWPGRWRGGACDAGITIPSRQRPSRIKRKPPRSRVGNAARIIRGQRVDADTRKPGQADAWRDLVYNNGL